MQRVFQRICSWDFLTLLKAALFNFACRFATEAVKNIRIPTYRGQSSRKEVALTLLGQVGRRLAEDFASRSKERLESGTDLDGGGEYDQYIYGARFLVVLLETIT